MSLSQPTAVRHPHWFGRPMPLTYSQFESIPSYDFLGIFTSHKAKGRCGRLKGKRGRGTSADEKNPVFGMVERGGLVCLRVLPNVKQQTIKPLIKSCVSQGATFYTDEYNIYNKLEGWGYTHKVVNHGQGEYARDEDGDGFYEVHCNTLEGIWSLLRSWLRPHRGVSQEKLWVSLSGFTI